MSEINTQIPISNAEMFYALGVVYKLQVFYDLHKKFDFPELCDEEIERIVNSVNESYLIDFTSANTEVKKERLYLRISQNLESLENGKWMADDFSVVPPDHARNNYLIIGL